LNNYFATETIKEGKVRATVPKLSEYKKKPSDYAPSKAPVFYNPIMELNRDFAVLALQAHQRLLGIEVSACEPLTGCGLRSIRLAVEVEGVRKVFLNDIKPEAAGLAALNVELNRLEDKAEVSNMDANLFLSRHAAPKKRLDYIDVDPFGSPVPYIDSAIRAIRNNGLLALTATDMAPLCGVYPRACLRKYGGYPLRTEYCHELAVRLVAGCLAMMAAKHAIGIEVLFSYSVDHYVRVYAALRYGAKLADRSVQQMGYILHCFQCLHRETAQGILTPLGQVCPNCGEKLNASGPLWLGNIADEDFCRVMEQELEKKSLGQKKRAAKILSLVKTEAEAPPTYFTIDKICDKLNLPVPALNKVTEKLRAEGFNVYRTHFSSTGFKTKAPIKIIKKIVLELTA